MTFPDAYSRVPSGAAPPPYTASPSLAGGVWADLKWLVTARPKPVLKALAVSFGIGAALLVATFVVGLALVAAVLALLAGTTTDNLGGALLIVTLTYFAAQWAASALGAAVVLANGAAVVLPGIDQADPRSGASGLRASGSLWLRAFGVALAAQILVGIGLLLCVIPGIVAYFFLMLAPFEKAADPGVSVGDAIRRSGKRFQSAVGELILVVLLGVGLGMLLVLPGLVLVGIASAVTEDPYTGESNPVIGFVVSVIFFGLVAASSLLLQLVLALAFNRLRARDGQLGAAVPYAGWAPPGVPSAAWAPADPALGQPPADSTVQPQAPAAEAPVWSPPPVAPTASPAPATSVPPPVPSAADFTIRRDELPAAPPAWRVVLPDGSTVPLTALTLLGRDPVAQPEEYRQHTFAGVTLVAVPDDTRMVSKTHLAIGVDELGVWAADRNSTNGSTLRSGGLPVAMPAGERVRLPGPAELVLGDVVIRVEQG